MSDFPDYVRAIYTSVKNTWQDAENLDDTHGYISYIWVPEETARVDVMKLAVFAEKFRAYSKSALAGGAQTKTSTVATPSHTHDVAIGTKTSAPSGGHSHTVSGATSSYQTASHTHDVVIGAQTSTPSGGHSHTVTGATSSYVTPSHTHDVVIGTKTSTSESSHMHKLGAVTMSGAKTQSGYMGIYNAAGDLIARVLTEHISSDQPYTYGAAQAHSHDIDYGTKTTASGGGNHAHTVSGQTTSTQDNHTHSIDYGTKTSASGGASHAHTVSGQTTSTQDNHTHSVAIGTVTSAAGAGSHSHDVTIDDHTHPIDFGIYEEAITGRTLSAVLYDPEGNVLKDFGVVLTGEDNDVLDLSEYFATLKYGMYRLVLSASGRLRARLVFYELCKMYAQW
jgi:hypothetical protein